MFSWCGWEISFCGITSFRGSFVCLLIFAYNMLWQVIIILLICLMYQFLENYWFYVIFQSLLLCLLKYVLILPKMLSKEKSASRRSRPRPNTTPTPSRSSSRQSRNMDTNCLIGQTMKVQDWLNDKTLKTLQVCYMYTGAQFYVWLGFKWCNVKVFIVWLFTAYFWLLEYNQFKVKKNFSLIY